MNVVNVVASKGENNYSSTSSSSSTNNRPHSQQQQHETMKNEAMKQWRLANCFVCLFCVAALLIPFGFVSKIAPLLRENDDADGSNGSTATGGRDSIRNVSFCVSCISALIYWIISHVLNRNKMNIRQNKLASYTLAGLYFLSLFCMLFCYSLFTIICYCYFYYYHPRFLRNWMLCFWIVIVTYATFKASINLSAVAPACFGNVQGKRKSLLLMARILLLSLMAVLINAGCTLGIPAWLSSNNNKMLPTAAATTEPVKFINSETWLFEAAVAVGFFLSFLDVCFGPKKAEKYFAERMMGGESATKGKVQLYDILFCPINSS